jgi:hypothetical protein
MGLVERPFLLDEGRGRAEAQGLAFIETDISETEVPSLKDGCDEVVENSGADMNSLFVPLSCLVDHMRDRVFAIIRNRWV